jgi:hypothetical protein
MLPAFDESTVIINGNKYEIIGDWGLSTKAHNPCFYEIF